MPEMKISSMVPVELVVKTAFGVKTNVCAPLDSSALLVFAEHVILEHPTMELIAYADSDTSEQEIYVLLATKAAVNVADLKLINVWLALMFHLSFKMVSAQRTLHVIMDSSLITDNVPNVLTTVSNVKTTSNVKLVLLDTKLYLKLSQDKKL